MRRRGRSSPRSCRIRPARCATSSPRISARRRRRAAHDTAGREAHLTEAERAYREALLLKPFHVRAKWNLELVNRLRRGGGQNQPNPPPPPSPGGGGGGGGAQPPPPPPSGGNGMNESQADHVLRSIGQEELRTRRDRTGRKRRAASAGVKDWCFFPCLPLRSSS